MLLLCHPVFTTSLQMLEMLSIRNFKHFYPDWKYVESYMEDIDLLIRLYPNAQGLYYIKAKIYEYIFNHAKALEMYKDLYSRKHKLDRFLSKPIYEDIQRLEVVKKQ
ncbi:MAG: hypothetical protein MJH11_18010 [Lentisphaeria bacterium]|nr:hypothetical protein [Lentisphaeria bacterium]